MECYKGAEMTEDKKTYNGHTYSGNLLSACLNGYEQGRADERAEILATIDWLINTDYSSREFESFKSVLFEMLKEQKNEN